MQGCFFFNQPPLARENPGIWPSFFPGSANGILSSCHCPNSPWGGLAKRAWLLDQLRAVAGSSRVIVLDSGDLFPLDPASRRASLMLRFFNRMGYKAVGFNDPHHCEVQGAFSGHVDGALLKILDIATLWFHLVGVAWSS